MLVKYLSKINLTKFRFLFSDLLRCHFGHIAHYAPAVTP